MRRGRFYDGRDRYSRQGAAAGPSASWALGGLGADTDWAFVGNCFFDVGAPDKIAMEDGEIGSASLTGAALTAQNAAVSNNTACSVTLTASNYDSGSLEISIKGGAFVDMLVIGNGPFTKTITSGSGSGFVVRETTTATILKFTDIDIVLA